MEAQRTTGQPNMREYRRAAICFAVLALVFAAVFLTDPNLENFLQGLGRFAAGLVFFMLLLRDSRNRQENVQRPRSAASSLFAVLAVVFISVLLVILFDYVLLDVWTELVPLTVSGFLEGLIQGIGPGIVVYLISTYGGSYGPSNEDIRQALRGLRIVAVALALLALAVVGVYIAIEYVVGPMIRSLANVTY